MDDDVDDLAGPVSLEELANFDGRGKESRSGICLAPRVVGADMDTKSSKFKYLKLNLREHKSNLYPTRVANHNATTS